MSEWTNCQNCGAVINTAADRCAYCGTPYNIHIRTAMLLRQVDMALITPNEARERLGLPPKTGGLAHDNG